jgi:hypothetical protein
MTTRFRTARRFGFDEADRSEELRKMLDDPELDAGDLVAALIEHVPEDKMEDLYQSLGELGQDRRGPRSWARDRLERRAIVKDMRERRARDRRLGRDEPEPFSGRPRPGGEVDPIFAGLDDRGWPVENFRRSDADRQIDEAADRRRLGSDMAMDGRHVLRFITGG